VVSDNGDCMVWHVTTDRRGAHQYSGHICVLARIMS